MFALDELPPENITRYIILTRNGIDAKDIERIPPAIKVEGSSSFRYEVTEALSFIRVEDEEEYKNVIEFADKIKSEEFFYGAAAFDYSTNTICIDPDASSRYSTLSLAGTIVKEAWVATTKGMNCEELEKKTMKKNADFLRRHGGSIREIYWTEHEGLEQTIELCKQVMNES